jgi:quercetin dioxygenase-like cupin family protein
MVEVRRWPDPGESPSAGGVEARLVREGLTPHSWSNEPGHRYGEHDHGYHKVLYCVRGSIVFHTPNGDVALRPGDRLDLEPRTPHAATVGPDGVMCMEAAR